MRDKVCMMTNNEQLRLLNSQITFASTNLNKLRDKVKRYEDGLLRLWDRRERVRNEPDKIEHGKDFQLLKQRKVRI